MERWVSRRGFQWDPGNAEKNWIRHRVTRAECEEVFFNQPLIVTGDERHSEEEQRFLALGQSDSGRYLFIAYTHRGELIRVISARDMTPKERRGYEDVRVQELKEDPDL